MIEQLYVAAREVLLDALDALGEQREALILAGAQAIYIHTGAADLAVAEFTTDGDLVVNPEKLKTQPRLSEAMERAHFRSGLQPGSWLCDRTVSGIATTIPIDLLVPEAVAGPGRRGSRPVHAPDRLRPHRYESTACAAGYAGQHQHRRRQVAPRPASRESRHPL